MESDKRKTRLDFQGYQRFAPAANTPESSYGTGNHPGQQETSKLRDLDLPKVVEQRAVPRKHLPQSHQSPWFTYDKLYQLYFGDTSEGRVTVAEKRSANFDLVVVKKTAEMDDKLALIQKTRHPNIVSVREVFRCKESVYTVFEHFPISLYYCLRNSRINETTLAAMLAQITQGLECIENQGLEHGSLSCSNILLNVEGVVKIFNPGQYRSRGNGVSQDVKALSVVAMELMGGSPDKNERLKVKDPGRWPLDSKAVKFLLEAQIAKSSSELLKQPLLKVPWQRKQLGGLVDLALIQTDRLHRLPKNR